MTSDIPAFLAEIRARAEAATPGPWSAHDFGYPGEEEPSSIVIHTGKFDWNAIREGETAIACLPAWDRQESDNAEFIAHARTDVEHLVAAVEAVLTECADIELDWPLNPAAANQVSRSIIRDIRAAVAAALTPGGTDTDA